MFLCNFVVGNFYFTRELSIMKNRYTYDEIMKIESILMSLAMYEACGGFVRTGMDEQDTLDFYIKVSKLFNEYKMMLRNGEITLMELKDQIANKYGAVRQDPYLESDDIDGLIKDIGEENDARERTERMIANIKKSLAALNINPTNPQSFIIPLEGDNSLYNEDNEKTSKKRPRKSKSDN